MSSATTIPAVVRSVTVSATLDHAFRVFTERFTSWWPPGYHIGEVEMAEAVLEPRAGGRWYERGVDGSECDWGTVLAWDPPRRVLLAWQIDGEWHRDPDPAHASEVEVTFTDDAPDRTTVTVEHRNFDRLAHANSLSEAIGGEGGWGLILTRYTDATQAA